MPNAQWENLTDKRFVAFFDILGFKDMVLKNSHNYILKKLTSIKETIKNLENVDGLPTIKAKGVKNDQTKSVTFSDSIIIFSEGETENDALKLFYDAYKILIFCIDNGISIKGAISYGEITVDFEKSLFFGQPIIDAYLLHEELQMLTIVLDNAAEERLKTLSNYAAFSYILHIYKANLRSGKITHTLIKPSNKKRMAQTIENLNGLYKFSSGKPRLYIDNTLDFLNSLSTKEEI